MIHINKYLGNLPQQKNHLIQMMILVVLNYCVLGFFAALHCQQQQKKKK